MFWEEIRKHNITLLAGQIRGNGGKCEDTAESIIENLKYLAETGESYGEEKKFLRLDVRRSLANLCETGRIIFKPINISYSENKEVCIVGGYLYEIHPDGTEIIVSSYSVGGAYLKDVYSQEMMEDEKRRASLLSLATARAESNAYFNAGIGIEFKGGDVFNLEAIEAQIKPSEPVMPTPTPQTERKKRGRKPKAEISSAESTEDTLKTDAKEPEPLKETEQVNEMSEDAVDAAITDAGTSTETTDITYEDALKEILDCGNYAGSTIGEILEKPQTARNICWCYKQNPEGRTERMKNALKVAIEGYNGGALMRFI